jgi:site-specific recombinase
MMDAWWTQQTAGLIGGVGGTAVGMLGGLIGALGGIFASKGRFRPLVFSLMYVALAIGLVCLAGGLAAVVVRQPFWVCYPLLLIGVVAILAFGTTFFVLRLRYQQAEMRQLEAEELRRSG